MGQITSLFAHKVVAQTHPSLDRLALLRSVGVDPQEDVDPSLMIKDIDYYSLLESIAKEDPNAIDLPLRTGNSMHCDDYGAFGLAWKSALTLRESYKRAERYARILTSVSLYEVQEAPEGAYMKLHRQGDRRLGLRLSNEATIASIVSISQEVATEPFKPLAVYFKHSAPESVSAHELHFGCEVYFDSGMDALLVSPESLEMKNQLGDQSISRFFAAHLEEELSQYGESDLLGLKVRKRVSQSLSGGIPKISDIARDLGMSGRTLQRRLSELGYTFQGLVDESQRQLAERLLQRTQFPIADIAFLTGFSEQSAFNRAFRRWAGQTPRSYRLAANSSSP